MKYKNLLLPGLLIVVTHSPVYASSDTATGCEAKRNDIQKEIEYAREYGRSQRLAGLEKALHELDSHCTDAGLRAEREYKVREKIEKVEERRKDLTEAQAEGRTDKIEKRQRKLEEAQEELNVAIEMLNK